MTARMGVVQVALLAALVAVYYGAVLRVVGEPLARRVLNVVAEKSAWVRTWSLADADAVSRLVLAGLMQAAFLVALIVIFPVSWGKILPQRVDLVLILLGVVLGVAEAALGTQLAFLASRVVDAAQRHGQPMSLEAWLTVARGGWMRYYLRSAAAAPRPLLIAATGLYVVGEELVFRGVVLGSSLHVLGAGSAAALSVFLFLLAQVFYTPGWRTALFPLMGALVVGVTHAYLFIVVPDITPLIVAHETMFLVTVL